MHLAPEIFIIQPLYATPIIASKRACSNKERKFTVEELWVQLESTVDLVSLDFKGIFEKSSKGHSSHSGAWEMISSLEQLIYDGSKFESNQF